MSYFSQTGNIVIDTKQSQSTAREAERIGGVVFHPFNSDRFFKKNGVVVDNKNKEELTKEEEDRFYKKAMKTDLL